MIHKNLLVLFGFTLVVMFIALSHLLFQDTQEIINAQTKSVKLTRFADLSLSVFWYEPRVSRYEISQYAPYPEMPPINSLSFVYKAR